MRSILSAGVWLVSFCAALQVSTALDADVLFPVRDNLLSGYIDKSGKVVSAGYELADDFADGVALVKVEGRYGFMDAAGSLIVKPQYAAAGRFSEGLAPVQVGKLWGYVDKTGALAIQPQYAQARSFSEGLAAVQMGDKWGYIDKTGKPAIPATFERASEFADGLAVVSIGARFGAIDKNGNIKIQPLYEEMGAFSEGLSVVRLDGRYGYVNKAGEAVIPPQFVLAGSFADGLAPVKAGTKYGYIDRTGTAVVQPKYDEALAFAEGLAPVMVSKKEAVRDDKGRLMSFSIRGCWGYIDATGREVIALELAAAQPFSEGVAQVRSQGQIAYIDKTGKTVLATPYNKSAGGFHGGLARVEIGEKWGYIDAGGKMVVPLQFDSAAELYEGLAVVQRGNLWGYINQAGQVEIQPQFDGASSFARGFATVQVKGKWGIIDRTGKAVLEPRFGSIRGYSDKLVAAEQEGKYRLFDWAGQPVLPELEVVWCPGHDRFLVTKDGEYGAVDGTGKIVIPLEYDVFRALLIGDGLLAVGKDGKHGFVDLDGKVVIPLQYDDVTCFVTSDPCAVQVGEKWGFIDRTGKMVIQPQYDSAGPFYGELAAVKVGDVWGFVDQTGKTIAKPQFQGVTFAVCCGLTGVKVGDKWGFLDKAGKMAIPAQFDEIRDFSDGLAWVKIGQQTAYIDTSGKMVWKSYAPVSELDRAIQDYPRAIEQDPKDTEAYVSRAKALVDKKDYDAALKDFDKALEIDPRNAAAWYGKGEVAGRLGRAEESRKAFEKAAELGHQGAAEALKKPAVVVSEDQMKIDLGDGVTMKLVRLPAGEFVMGGDQSPEELARLYGGLVELYREEQPQHRVRITRPFYMGATEVTNAQFQAFVSSSGYATERELDDRAWVRHSWRDPGFEQGASHPVIYVSWNDATAFCQWLSKRTGMPVRLPTEAEWEYACRAGTTGRFWWGESATAAGKYANVSDRTALREDPEVEEFGRDVLDTDDGYAKSAPVGSYRPNAWGLYDMIGNAFEWCADWHGKDYYGSSPVDDPQGPSSGEYRVLRGGGWDAGPTPCRSAYRRGWEPGDATESHGFRVVVGQ